MASPVVVLWKLAGRSLVLLKTWDRGSKRYTAMLRECRSWTTSFKKESTGNWELSLSKRKSWFISTPPQITAYKTTPWDRRGCWEGNAGVMKCPRTNANLCATNADWNTKRWKITSKLSVGVSSCGVAVWNVTHARRSILWQLARSGKLCREKPPNYKFNCYTTIRRVLPCL